MGNQHLWKCDSGMCSAVVAGRRAQCLRLHRWTRSLETEALLCCEPCCPLVVEAVVVVVAVALSRSRSPSRCDGALSSSPEACAVPNNGASRRVPASVSLCLNGHTGSTDARANRTGPLHSGSNHELVWCVESKWQTGRYMGSNHKQLRLAVMVGQDLSARMGIQSMASVEKEVDCNRRPRCSLRWRVYLTLECGDWSPCHKSASGVLRKQRG